MTIEEFSSGFDTLLNSYATIAAFGKQDGIGDIRLDEYEKSFYLTKAQEEVVLSLYNGKNVYGESFELTEELRRYLSSLICEASLNPDTSSSGYPIGIESSSRFFTLPEDLWFITYEAAHVTSNKCGNEGMMDVTPVTQDEYHKVKRNPFRGANDRRALRLDLSDGVVEIVCKYDVDKYYVRYLTKLHPIILEDMPTGVLNVEEVAPRNCELHEGLHQRILERAVEMALRSKGIYAKENNKTRE